MAQENSALIRRWFEEVWNKGRMEAIDEMASPDAIGHGQAQHDTDIGLKEFRTFAVDLRTCLSRFEGHHRPGDRTGRQSGGPLDFHHDSRGGISGIRPDREESYGHRHFDPADRRTERSSKAGTTGTSWGCWCRLGRCLRRILWRLRWSGARRRVRAQSLELTCARG